MFILFIQASLSRYTIDLTNQYISSHKFFKLYIEPFDVVEIKVNATHWALFSRWYGATKLLLTVSTEEKDHKMMEFGPYKSDLQITAIHFIEYNYTIKLTSDSADEQIISLMIAPTKYDKFGRQIFPTVHEYEFPFIQKFKESDWFRNQPDYPFYYDSDSTSSNIITYVFIGFASCYYLLWLYSDFDYIRNTLLARCLGKTIYNFAVKVDKLFNKN